MLPHVLFPTIVVAAVAIFSWFLLQKPSNEVIYAIGDLHGDAQCAAFWVERIGVVDSTNRPTKWMQPGATLVFMGDYIDRGPTSLQTIQFVKSLTDAFPSNVIALMGNHEMELLKDRDPTRPYKYYQLPYATTHPGEYLNYLDREPDEKDHFTLDVLLNASLEVYGNNWHGSFLFAPNGAHGKYGITQLLPEDVRPDVEDRLREYQNAYISAFASNTTLGQWLEQLPIVFVKNDVFFCHGGLSQTATDVVKDFENFDSFNNHVQTFTHEGKLLHFLENTRVGRATEELLSYRGNHKSGACDSLSKILNGLNGVTRLAVGHTPGRTVRQLCGGRLLALDSMLGRWIRTSGNQYCPNTQRKSQNGKFTCPNLTPTCQGQIVRIQGQHVELIES
jgi:hypothetical protein